MDDLTILGVLALLAYGAWNFKRNCRKAADAANNASPETKATAKAIGASGLVMPELAAWLPGAMFTMIGTYLLVRVRT